MKHLLLNYNSVKAGRASGAPGAIMKVKRVMRKQ